MNKKRLLLIFTILICFISYDVTFARNKPLENYAIMLDPGHGGDFKGTTAYNQITLEKNLNILRAYEVAAILKKYGARVELTRTTDESLKDELNADLKARSEKTNALIEQFPDKIILFISIHHNASENHKGRGTETYYWSPPYVHSYNLADKINGEIVKANFRDRGAKVGGKYKVLKELDAKIPAVLTEICFIDNEDDWSHYNGLRKNRVADALTIGILRYLDKVKSYTIEAESPDNEFQDTIIDDGWVKIDDSETLKSSGTYGFYGYGDSPGEFSYPVQIAADKDNNIYVTDRGRVYRVQKMTPEGVFSTFKQWPDDWARYRPYGIDIDTAGYIYVSHNAFGGNIEKYDKAGNFISESGKVDPYFRTPTGFAVSIWGDIYAGTKYSVYQLDSEFNMLKKADIDKRYAYEIDASADSEGNVYVILAKNPPEIRKYSRDLELLLSWGREGSGPGEFERYPRGIAVDKDGDVFVGDWYNQRIQKFNSEGEFLYEKQLFDSPDIWFIRPYGIEFDRAGNLWVVERGRKIDGSWFAHMEKFKVTVPTEGIITTQLVNFPNLFSYIGIVPTEEITVSTAQFINYEYSIDGTNWNDVADGKILMEVSTATKNIQYRITLNRKEGYESPALDKVVVEYVDWGSDTSSTVSPGGSSGGSTVNAVNVFTDKKDEFEKGEIYVFPNPAKVEDPTFHLEFTNADKIKLAVYNIAAELIFEKEVLNPRDVYEWNWDTSGIPSGVYIYVARALKQGEKNIKVIKKLALIK